MFFIRFQSSDKDQCLRNNTKMKGLLMVDVEENNIINSDDIAVKIAPTLKHCG